MLPLEQLNLLKPLLKVMLLRLGQLALYLGLLSLFPPFPLLLVPNQRVKLMLLPP